MNYSDYAALMQIRQRQQACPCAYCQGRGMASSQCPCVACQRAASNANLARLGLVAGDVRGYGGRGDKIVSGRGRMLSGSYGQRNGGCGCDGSR